VLFAVSRVGRIERRDVADNVRRPERIKIAAANNAAWCHTMCRSHGIVGTFTPQAWLSSRRTPVFYPDAVTLTADAAVKLVVDGIDTTAGCSIKDSFGVLDLGAEGFERLLDSSWLWRPAGDSPPTRRRCCRSAWPR